LRQPLRCRGDQSGSLFELLKALRILPDHDLLYYTLNSIAPGKAILFLAA
jgi:hypothetical protein